MSGQSLCLLDARNDVHRAISAAGVPVVPGYHGTNQDPEYLKQEASRIGDPAHAMPSLTNIDPRIQVIPS